MSEYALITKDVKDVILSNNSSFVFIRMKFHIRDINIKVLNIIKKD